MGIARILFVLLVLLPSGVQAKEGSGFKRTVAGAEVDWSAGTITAQAGAAADIHMPGPDSARPGAERRARAAAEAKLRAALALIARGTTIDQDEVLKHASLARTEYQSDGGVVLWLSVRFTDLVAAKPASAALKVAAMPFELAPALVGAAGDLRLGFATYRPSSEAPRDAIPVQRDGKGRLLVPASVGAADSLAGSAVVIYLESVP
jgi:hypothetical protein